MPVRGKKGQLERKPRNPIREGGWKRGSSTSEQQLSGAKENGQYRQQAANHPNGSRGARGKHTSWRRNIGAMPVRGKGAWLKTTKEKEGRKRIPNKTGPTLSRQRQQEPGAGAHYSSKLWQSQDGRVDRGQWNEICGRDGYSIGEAAKGNKTVQGKVAASKRAESSHTGEKETYNSPGESRLTNAGETRITKSPCRRRSASTQERENLNTGLSSEKLNLLQ